MNAADEMKTRSQGHSCNMSPAAMTRRLEIVSQLFTATRWLSRAMKVGNAPQDDFPTASSEKDEQSQ
jgi:hypothetical protein